MKRQVINGVNVTEFSSITEMVNEVGASQTNMASFGSRLNNLASKKGTEHFTGTKNYEEALDLLKNGWSEGAKKLTHSLKVSNKKNQDVIKRAVFDVVGFQASVPRYLQGIPTNMVNKKTFKQKAKVVTLVKSISYHSGITTEEILEDSTKFLQIVQEIEKQGIRVNVHVAWAGVTINGNESFALRLPIKKANERFNVSKMSFPLMHSSFLRRIVFRAIETEPTLKSRQWTSGYGKPGQKKEFEKIINKNEYFIPVLVSEHEATKVVNGISEGLDNIKNPSKVR
jgi:hypothetical protein